MTQTLTIEVCESRGNFAFEDEGHAAPEDGRAHPSKHQYAPRTTVTIQ